MNFIKKRLFLIACLLAVTFGIGIFISALLTASDNQKDMQKIQKKCNDVKSSLPKKIVPRNVMERIESNAQLADTDRDAVKTLAHQTTDRPVIYEPVFPELKNENDRIYHYQVFSDQYCRLIDKFLLGLQAGDSPSDAEEEKKREEFPNISGTSSQSRSASENEQIEKLLEDFRRERAKQISIYATTDSFCCYDHWKSKPMGDKKTMLLDSWFTQVAAWIQHDVVQAIEQINSSSDSVFDSPVKRLIEISFSGSAAAGKGTQESIETTPVKYKGGAPRHYSESQIFLPAYITKIQRQGTGDPTAGPSIKGEMVPSFTKRACDDLIHVVHFEVGVVIDSTKINDFFTTLQSEKYTYLPQPDGTNLKQNKRNQITVIHLNIEPVNIEAESSAGYYYGPASVKVLRLVGEYVFFAGGYEKYLPQPVKDIIKPPVEATSTTTGSLL